VPYLADKLADLRAANRASTQRRRGSRTGRCPWCCQTVAVGTHGVVPQHKDANGAPCDGYGRLTLTASHYPSAVRPDPAVRADRIQRIRNALPEAAELAMQAHALKEEMANGLAFEVAADKLLAAANTVSFTVETAVALAAMSDPELADEYGSRTACEFIDLVRGEGDGRAIGRALRNPNGGLHRLLAELSTFVDPHLTIHEALAWISWSPGRPEEALADLVPES
jgi:hypothetical protein